MVIFFTRIYMATYTLVTVLWRTTTWVIAFKAGLTKIVCAIVITICIVTTAAIWARICYGVVSGINNPIIIVVKTILAV
jgi:hypothetical protein